MDETTSFSGLGQAGVGRREFLATSGKAVGAAAGLYSDRALAQMAGPPAGSGSGEPSPAPKTVLVEKRADGILLIGINRPEAKNFLDPPTFVALGQAFYQFEHDEALRVAVLYAVGPDFVPGLDVAAFGAAARAGTFPSKTPRTDIIDPLDMAQPRRSKPLVVAVQGATKRVGHELFLAADVRVAASDTVFSQDEASLGLFPGGGATVRFAREAGRGNAMRHMLTGEPWGAEEAYRYGLVQAVTPPGQQLDRAIELARKIAAAAPLGIRATLASVHATESDDERAFAPLRSELARLMRTEDFQEFVVALREKRPPIYRGQ
jgi:enoyl-CoA hydratase